MLNLIETNTFLSKNTVFFIIADNRAGGSPDDKRSPPSMDNGAANCAFVALPAYEVSKGN